MIRDQPHSWIVFVLENIALVLRKIINIIGHSHHHEDHFIKSTLLTHLSVA